MMIPPMRHAFVRAAVIGGGAMRVHLMRASNLQPCLGRSLFVGHNPAHAPRASSMIIKAPALPAPVAPGRGHVAGLALVSFKPVFIRSKATAAAPTSAGTFMDDAPEGHGAKGEVERIEVVETEQEHKTGSERIIGW